MHASANLMAGKKGTQVVENASYLKGQDHLFFSFDKYGHVIQDAPRLHALINDDGFDLFLLYEHLFLLAIVKLAADLQTQTSHDQKWLCSKEKRVISSWPNAS